MGFFETKQAQDQKIAQELFAKAHARQLLEEVRDYWGIGEIITTPLSLTIAYKFPIPLPFSKMSNYHEARDIHPSHLDGKYYLSQNGGYAINIKPFAHSDFERSVPYHCLRVRLGVPLMFEIIRILGESLEECDYDLLKLLKQDTQIGSGLSKIECIQPDERVADKLRKRVLTICSDPYEILPLQQEQTAKNQIKRFNDQGVLYSSKEDLLQAARTEQAATAALQTPKRTGLALLLPH